MTDDFARDPRIAAPQAELDRTMADLNRTVADARTRAERYRAPSLSKDDLAKIEQHARSREAPPALRELQRRIDKGELSWNDVVSGTAIRDEGVQAALASGVSQMQQAYTELQEGAGVADVINRTSRDDPDDEEGFGPVMRRVW